MYSFIHLAQSQIRPGELLSSTYSGNDAIDSLTIELREVKTRTRHSNDQFVHRLPPTLMYGIRAMADFSTDRHIDQMLSLAMTLLLARTMNVLRFD